MLGHTAYLVCKVNLTSQLFALINLELNILLAQFPPLLVGLALRSGYPMSATESVQLQLAPIEGFAHCNSCYLFCGCTNLGTVSSSLHLFTNQDLVIISPAISSL